MTVLTWRTGPRRFVMAAVALIALASVPALAQERFGGLTGTVKDASGAVLPGVTVTITNKETAKVYTAVSGGDGVYRVLDLEPGRYSVQVRALRLPGRRVRRTSMLLLGKTLDVDSVAEGRRRDTRRSRVTAESPLIDTKSTTIAHNVTAEEFDRIPKGRSFQNLAISSPSVNAGDIEGGIQVNGASGAENSFTVDGVVDQQPGRRPLAPGRGVRVPAGSAGQDRRHQRRVRRRARRRHQRGHQVGRQQLPRRRALLLQRLARSAPTPVKRLVLDPRDDVDRAATTRTRSRTHNRHDVGGSLGGPIVKDKLFFFGSLAPRYVRRTERLPVQRRHRAPAAIDQKQTYHERVRQGELRPDQPAAHQLLDAVRRRPRRPGSLPAYDGIGAERRCRARRRRTQIEQDARLRAARRRATPARSDYTLTNTSLLSVRGGPLRRQLQGHGRPDHQQRRRTRRRTSACRLSRSPTICAAASASRTRRACSSTTSTTPSAAT